MNTFFYRTTPVPASEELEEKEEKGCPSIYKDVEILTISFVKDGFAGIN